MAAAWRLFCEAARLFCAATNDANVAVFVTYAGLAVMTDRNGVTTACVMVCVASTRKLSQ